MRGGARVAAWLAAALMALTLVGCSTTRIDRGHPLIQGEAGESYARVYFIRPNTEHPQGFADNPLLVEAGGEPLMRLGKGEYAMVHLKARDITITLRDLTQVRGRWEVTEMKQSRKFNFEAGQTYYLLAKNVDGEFRGVTFIPEIISQFDGDTLRQNLRDASGAKGLGSDDARPVGSGPGNVYLGAQYGYLNSEDASMGNVGLLGGYSLNRWLSLEAQATTTIVKDEIGIQTLSSNSFGLFAAVRSAGKIYGKGRLGVARVRISDEIASVALSDAASSLAYGATVGFELGRGAIEAEYTRLPTIKDFVGAGDVSNSYFALGYMYRF